MLLFFSYICACCLPRTEFFELSNRAPKSSARPLVVPCTHRAHHRLALRCRAHATCVAARARSVAPARRSGRLLARGRGASRLIVATGSLLLATTSQLSQLCTGRPDVLPMAQARSPPGGGLSARRWHPELGASSNAPSSSSEEVQLCATSHNWHLHTGHEGGHGSKRRAPARRFHLSRNLGPP